MLPKIQATQHGSNFPSRSYRKLRSVPIDILINVQEYVPVLECWCMFFRCLASYSQLSDRLKLSHLVQQYCEYSTGLVRYQWVFYFAQTMLVPDNSPQPATHLEIGSDVAIPAASFVIIRRLSLMIRRSNDIAPGRDVSGLASLLWNIHHKVWSESRAVLRPFFLPRVSCNPDVLMWVNSSRLILSL